MIEIPETMSNLLWLRGQNILKIVIKVTEIVV